MNSINTAIYHTHDSVDNLRIKVIVRETSRRIGGDRNSSKPHDEEITFSWQEKKYGPRDIAGYFKNKDEKFHNSNESDMFRHMNTLEERGKPVNDMLKPIMLYTYTDKNPNVPMERIPVRFSEDENLEPYLGLAVNHDINHPEIGIREKKASERIYREKPFKLMHICLATDVDVDALKNKPMYPEAYYNEHILCSIKVYNDGLLEFTPNLSQNKDEIGGKNSDIIVNSLFVNDETVAASLNSNKGMKLSTYKVYSKSGREFEYAIINVNEVVSPLELESMRRNDLSKDAIQARQSRVIDEANDSNDGSTPSSWKQDPPSRGHDKSMVFYAEIVSGKGFHGDRLLVDYEVLLPQGWDLRTGNLVDGMNEIDLINKASKSNLDRDRDTNTLINTEEKAIRNLLNVDGYDDGENAKGMLRGVTQMALATEIAGGLSLPIHRPLWKGNRLNYMLGSFSRYIFGLSYLGFNVACLILGIYYPLWIIISITIIFALGTGTQGGTTQAITFKEKLNIQKNNTGQNKNIWNRSISGTLVSEPIANFNHLINLSFDIKDNSHLSPCDVGSPSSSVPTIIFTVYSVGTLGQICLEGYAYHHLPTKSGCSDVNISTWKPLGGIEAQMRDYFLGSSPHLLDKIFINNKNKFTNNLGVNGNGNNKDKSNNNNNNNSNAINSLNRFGVRSENSGTIRFRIHSATTDPRNVKKEIMTAAKLEEQKLDGARRTVNEILKNYRGGSDLSRSMEMAAGKLGMTLTKGPLTSMELEHGGNKKNKIETMSLSAKAELLISQARQRMSASGTNFSALDASRSYTSTQEYGNGNGNGNSGGEGKSNNNSRNGSLSPTRRNVTPLEMDRVPGASSSSRRDRDTDIDRAERQRLL
jgi:hypothetical protein